MSRNSRREIRRGFSRQVIVFGSVCCALPRVRPRVDLKPGDWQRTERSSDFEGTLKTNSVKTIVLFLIYAAFISLGLPDGILGAAWPAMRTQFAVPLNGNWPMLALATCGGALSSFLSGLALRRLGVRAVLLLTTFLTSLVIAAYALSPTFAFITGFSLLLGLGNGAIDAGLNNFVASNLSSRHMNWLHAFWGIGVCLGTLTVSGILALHGSWRTAYLVVSVFQLSLGVAFFVNLRELPTSAAPEHSGSQAAPPSFGSTLLLPATWASMTTFFVYCGIESGTGLWISSLLHDGRGWKLHTAGLMVTLYWASLTVGRFLVGTFSQRTTPMRIVRIAVVGVLVGASLMALSSALSPASPSASAVTALGLMISGFSLSPIYPMLVHDTARCVGHGHALNLIGIEMGGGSLGYTLLPILTGTLMRTHSIEWLGGTLAGLATLLLLAVATRDQLALRYRAGIANVSPE